MTYVNELQRRAPVFALGALAFFMLIFSQLWTVQGSKAKRQLIPPPQQIERMTFGFSEIMADLIWIRAIQDFDYCENLLAKHLCVGNGWLFRMLDAVTDLSPKFRMPYATGGIALTVIVSDYEGATKIFNKGVAAFPSDWKILYRAAYHFLYDGNDKERAAELLIQAAKNGAPPWTYALAGRLYSDSGKLDLARALLAEMRQTGQEPAIIERLQKKIEEIERTNR